MPPPPLKMKQKVYPKRCSRRKESRENLVVEFQFGKSRNNFESSFNSFYRYRVVKFHQCLLFNISLIFSDFCCRDRLRICLSVNVRTGTVNDGIVVNDWLSGKSI